MNDEAMTKAENERYEFLAKKFTEEELSYREIIPCLSLKTIVGAIAGTIYSMHPFGVAHGVSKICNEIQRILRQNEDALHPEFTYKKIGLDFECLEDVKPADLLTFLDRELKKIPEFVDFNLSLNEKRMNITVDDPNRNRILFTTRLSTTARENDFIDLDACIRNIYYEILLHDMEDLTSPIRNMRYLNNPQIKGQMEIPMEEKEEKKEDPDVIVLHRGDPAFCPHKDLIEIDSIVGAIHGYFYSQRRMWAKMSPIEFERKVAMVASDFASYLLTIQSDYCKRNSMPNFQWIGYDQSSDLRSLLDYLKVSKAFLELVEIGNEGYYDMCGEKSAFPASNHLTMIWYWIIFAKHPGISTQAILDYFEDPGLTDYHDPEEEEETPKENPKGSIADPFSPLLGVELRHIESVIAEELYLHRVDFPEIEDFGIVVQNIINAFLVFVKNHPDEEIHSFGDRDANWWRFQSWSKMVFFSGKVGVQDFVSNLFKIPQFVQLAKNTRSMWDRETDKFLGTIWEVNPVTMMERMADHLLTIAKKRQDAEMKWNADYKAKKGNK